MHQEVGTLSSQHRGLGDNLWVFDVPFTLDHPQHQLGQAGLLSSPAWVFAHLMVAATHGTWLTLLLTSHFETVRELVCPLQENGSQEVPMPTKTASTLCLSLQMRSIAVVSYYLAPQCIR